jgi:hypothetical protein
VPLAVGAMVADGRRRWYVLAGVLTTVFFTLEIPWWGQALLGHHHSWHLFDRLLQDSYAFGALIALWLLGRMGLSDRVRTTSIGHDEPMSR